MKSCVNPLSIMKSVVVTSLFHVFNFNSKSSKDHSLTITNYSGAFRRNYLCFAAASSIAIFVLYCKVTDSARA